MKRKEIKRYSLAIVMVIVLVLATCFVGCGESDKDQNSSIASTTDGVVSEQTSGEPNKPESEVTNSENGKTESEAGNSEVNSSVSSTTSTAPEEPTSSTNSTTSNVTNSNSGNSSGSTSSSGNSTSSSTNIPYDPSVLSITNAVLMHQKRVEIMPGVLTYELSGEVSKAGATPQQRDVFEYGDYKYEYGGSGWRVIVLDTTKTAYGTILESINGKPVNDLWGTFFRCKSLTTAPVIPSTIYTISYTFAGLESLTGKITINATNLEEYNCCFDDTTQPIVLTGSCPLKTLEYIASEYDNVTVDPSLY